MKKSPLLLAVATRFSTRQKAFCVKYKAMAGMLQNTRRTYGRNRTFEWLLVDRPNVVVRFVGSARYDTSISQYDTLRMATNQTTFVDMQRYPRKICLQTLLASRGESYTNGWYDNLNGSGLMMILRKHIC